MNERELQFILQEGEGQFIEFKEKPDKRLAQEITAFANASGGRIFLGVSDKGMVKGIPVTNRLKSQVQDIARNCDPSIDIRMEESGNVLIVEIKEGRNKPYSCKEGFYLRQGANSQKMKRDDIIDFVTAESLARFDSSLDKKFDIEKDFSAEKLQKFLQDNEISSNLEINDLLANLELGETCDKKFLINNAGILLFAKNPQKYFNHAFFDCVLFKGNDNTEIIDRKRFTGTLFDQLDSVKKFVMRHINLSYDYKTDSFERTDVYQYPLRAIEEAVVNALIHRDYFFKGANISLHIYANRLEIVSPGGLPKGLSEKDFGKRSVRRNQIIADIFQRTPYVEQIGSGINRIKNDIRKANLPDPIIRFNSFFEVIINKPGSDKGSDKSSDKSSDRIVCLIKGNKDITIKELANKLMLSTRAIEKNISKLKERGIIARVGGKKGGYWEIEDE